MDRKNIIRGFKKLKVWQNAISLGEDYERLDQLHYKLENALLNLIESLQKK